MIKENKKNKLITFICACLMVCASALGLVSAVGTTLASSPTQPTITTAYFNYKDSNFLNLFDGYITKYKSGTTTQLVYTITHITDLPSSYNTTGFTIDNLYYLSGSNVYSQNTFVDGVYTTDGMFGGLPSITFTFANSTDLFAGINDIFSRVLVFSYNGTYYTICPLELYTKHIAYMEGIADADTSSAYNNGYNAGLQDGYTDGYGEGELDGYENGYQEGQDFGYGQGVIQGQNNVINNPNNYDLYTEQQYQQNYINGQNSVINNPNAFGLYTLAQYNDNYTAGYFAGYENGYDNGYVDGKDDGIDIGYQLGLSSNTAYDEGKQFVIDNPNMFNLYTEEDLQERYLEGFNEGVRTSREGVLYNSMVRGGIIYNNNGTITALDISQYIINSNGVYTLGNGFIEAYNDILSNYTIDYISFTIDGVGSDISSSKPLSFIMTDKTLINVITSTGIDRTTTFNVSYYVYDDYNVINDYDVVYRIIPVIENNIIVNYELDYDVPTELLNKRVASITFEFGNYLGSVPLSLITNFSVSDINNLAYNAGYENGFDDAMNSNIVDNAYDRGYTDGNRVGYQQGLSNGLANSNDYTFFGLIGAVIDAPIQYLSSLFNFNILGFNLLAFITSLFTVCVIIWIVKMLLGGK